MVNKKFWATAFTLSGTTIGAGILGLPYVFSKSGYLVGLAWLLFFGLIIIFVNLLLGEVTLRTKGIHQLTGYAEKYLGKTGKMFMLFAMLFGIYAAMLAYLIGEGESLSYLLTGTLKYSLIFGIIFWFILTLLLKEGLKGLKKVETWGVLAVILLIMGIFLWFAPSINLNNLTIINQNNFFLPIGVVLFSMLGFTAIPELRREIQGQEKQLKKAIIIGSLIPIFLYILFSLTFVGVLGNKVQEVASLSFGPIVIILGMFTMFSSYFVHSFILKDMYHYDYRLSKPLVFTLVSLFPLLLYIIVSLFNILGFVSVLGLGGIISGGMTGILILIINKRAKYMGKRKTEYKMPLNWLLIAFLIIIFITGLLLELLF